MLCAQPEPSPRKQLKLAREDSSGSGLVEGSQAGSTEAAQGAEPGGKAVPGQGKAGCPTVRLLALPGGSQLQRDPRASKDRTCHPQLFHPCSCILHSLHPLYH